MNRTQFLKTSFYFSVGLTALPQLSFSAVQSGYSKAQLIGKHNPDIAGSTYTSKMHKETAVAFQKMKQAATLEGIAIEIVSAFRSFDRQKEIYEAKYSTFTADGMEPEAAINKIIEYSTIPGTSRHHWGTDLDLIDSNAPRPENVLQPGNYHGKGPYCKLKEWLVEHAEFFGFFEVYTDDPQRKGFKYEPWHYSYAPVSVPMLDAYRKLNVKQILLDEKIKGSGYFTDDFISKYTAENILDINTKLL